MPGPQNNTSIPESITINGVTYQVKETPELQQFIQAVAKCEKTKLYSQMESLKAQIQSLGNVEVVPDGTKFDIDTLVEKLKGTFVTKDGFKEVIGDAVKEVVQPVLDATKRTEQNELNEYREKLIKDNAATCIPELVKGSTKEELDAALQESIRLRKAYPSPTPQEAPKYTGDPNLQKVEGQEQFQAQSPTPAQSAQPANPVPEAPRFPAPDASQSGDSPKQMSMKEFAEKREAMLHNLESMYGGGNL